MAKKKENDFLNMYKSFFKKRKEYLAKKLSFGEALKLHFVSVVLILLPLSVILFAIVFFLVGTQNTRLDIFFEILGFGWGGWQFGLFHNGKKEMEKDKKNG